MNTAGSFLSRLILLAAAGSLVACAGELNDSRFATGSSSVVASSDYQALYVANPDQGTISRVDVDAGTSTEIDVGLEPVRVARAGDLVFATLRGERAVAVLQEQDGSLVLQQRIELGAEPYGVVANEKGTTVWVANQLGGTVSEIDVETLSVVRDFPVDGQPRFLALHPSGNHLYVGSVMDGILTDIDLKTGAANALSIPENTGVDPETFEPITLSGRITGDLSVSADGTKLAIPTLYVNNVSPVGPPQPVDSGEPPSDGYAGGPDGTRRFNPGVTVFVTNQNGNLRVDMNDTLLSEGFGRGDAIASYPSAARFAPDGESIVLPLEGSDAALVVHVPRDIGDDARPGRGGGRIAQDVPMMEEFFGSTLRFADRETILTGSAPRGVAFLDREEAWVHNGFDYSVAALDFDTAAERLASRNPSGPGNRGGGAPGEEILIVEGDGAVFGPEALESGPAVQASAEILPADLAEGRRLFFSASNQQMAAPGAGVSCATCHFDVRNDGLTWQFDEGSRQTPSLAGEVSLTAPVTWVDNVETVFDEVMITSQGRMGGDGLSDEDAMKVAAFVDSTPLPDTPNRGVVSSAVERGREIFASEEVGCADCHSGEAFTDNETYDMYGLTGVRTRSLLGIASSAPYLHDGSAPTLHAIVESARDGEMGDTISLSPADVDDLVAYLKSL